MAQAPSKTARKPSATRSQTSSAADGAPPTLNRSHLQGFVVGCVVGLLGAVGIFNVLQAPEEPAEVAAASPPSIEEEAGPRFDFYTVLPNQELDLNPDIEPADLQSGAASGTQYLLQVGSFRQEVDADRRRGELALLGLDARIEPSDGSNGRWYRVYLGPFDSRSEMARARSLTAQADMDTLLLKREAP